MANFEVKQTDGQSELLISRGGRRAGSGRKKIGETRRLSLTLPAEAWEFIDVVADQGRLKTAEVIRDKLLMVLAVQTEKQQLIQEVGEIDEN